MTGSGPDGVLRVAAGGLQVAPWDDHARTRGSADNVHAYDRQVSFAEGDPHGWRAVGVRVSAGEGVPGPAVLLVPLGCRGPDAKTVIGRSGTPYLSTGPEVAALDVPSLQLRWKTRSQLACVFGLHEIPGEEALIVHGELAVARVEPDGRVAWERAGRDIFTGELRMAGEAVEVTDWDGGLYRFRVSDGEILHAPPPRLPETPARGWIGRFRAWLR